MFFRLAKYSMIRTMRQKELVFWCLLFPVILGTMFKVTFGDMTETEMTFHQIPVAYVEEEGAQNEFQLLIETLEQENELITVVKTEKEEAEKMLRKNEVEGIYFNGSEIYLTVAEEEVNQSILKNVLEQYERTSSTFENIAGINPAAAEKAAKTLLTEQNSIKQETITENKLDFVLNAFYSLLAMACLNGNFMGLYAAIEFKADLSPLGARRCVAGRNRFLLLISDVFSKITVQFLCAGAAICYLIFVLNIQMGSQFAHMLLILLAGSAVGVSMGTFIGAIPKIQTSVKEGLCVCITLALSFLAGLMVTKMYQIVENSVPLLNRINPAALIVNAFYSLNIYSDYDKFIQCILSIFGIVALLWIAIFFMVRRERYASI